MKAERLLEELKARLDIVDVISDYVQLRRAGRNYKGICPFHSEKTPSFIVSPDKQIFHCFGCNAGGNLAGFVMKYENVTFQEALHLLAKKAGIDLKGYKPAGTEKGLRERLVEIHKEASLIFSENLKKSRTAHAYLKDRGIAEATISAFSVGYALKDWHSLSQQLKDKGATDQLMLNSGLSASGNKGVYDIFRDRIIFPITDLQGDVIAFGGRVMDDSLPKYLNSPDTSIFHKRETLYGMSLAKDGIRKKGYAIITEGYFDVLLCHQNSLNNVVAPLGTALTQGHLHKLKRFTKKTVLVFDGDKAGKAAAVRSIPLMLEHGFAVKLLLLPGNEDPDSFIRKKGADAFNKLLSRSVSAVDFMLGFSRKDKTETVHNALEVISACSDTIMREQLIRELSEKSGIRETVLREGMRNISDKAKARHASLHPQRSSGPAACRYDEELLLLSAALAFPDKLDYILNQVSIDEFTNPAVRSLFEKLSASKDAADVSALTCPGNEEDILITRLALDPGFDTEHVDKNIEDCVEKITTRNFNRRLRDAELTGDVNLLNLLLMEKQGLLKKKSLQRA